MVTWLAVNNADGVPHADFCCPVTWFSYYYYYLVCEFMEKFGKIVWNVGSLNVMTLQVAEMIRHVIDRYSQTIPAILEIPSKEHPYDASKDSILRRAKVHNYLFTESFCCHTFHIWTHLDSYMCSDNNNNLIWCAVFIPYSRYRGSQ